MKFFFADSQDQIDPTFDFRLELPRADRVRQRDDAYAHEVFRRPPYDGILVSKALLDGRGRYSVAQRSRFYREGVRAFLRLERHPELRIMGDCGAFSYVDEEVPPYSVDEVLSFYLNGGFDSGVSPDHVILGYSEDGAPPESWKARRELTLEQARDFLSQAKRETRFKPFGVAQGWSPSSYRDSVVALQQMGYRNIAVGGMVPLKTRDILASLTAIDEVRRPSTSLHLLGITRFEALTAFANLGVASFDSTSPFRQAFKDDRDNYHTVGRNYTAFRVPQVDGNPRLRRLILAGEVQQETALGLETTCITRLRLYADRRCDSSAVIDALCEYEMLLGERKDRTRDYAEALTARPWETCRCSVCRSSGIEVMIFRGTERNKRRGFHNLYVFNARLMTLGGELGTLATSSA